jgi:predicted phosphoribosyltransferase
MLPDTFIICSEEERAILYSPHMAGKSLQDALDKLSPQLAEVLSKRLAGVPREKVCELVLLSGGLYYSLNYGFKRQLGFALPQCFIGIQRSRVEGKEGEFRAMAGYENFESLPEGAHVIIGDTVATGSTLVKGIQLLLDAAEDKGISLASITVVTIAGSRVGAEKLCALAKKHVFPQHPECKVSLFACEMLFHLMPDGTDLRFLMQDSIMPEESRQEAERRYGKYLGKNMQCAVFDWGTRCKNPRAHYAAFLEYCNRELATLKTDEKGRSVLLRMKKETEGALEEMEKPLQGFSR